MGGKKRKIRVSTTYSLFYFRSRAFLIVRLSRSRIMRVLACFHIVESDTPQHPLACTSLLLLF